MVDVTQLVSVCSHMAFILLTHKLLVQLFDWQKLIKVTADNLRLLPIFLMFLSIAIGSLVSHFILSVIQLSQNLFSGM